MEIKTTYQDAAKNYPKAVDAIVSKLRSGTSKEKSASPEDLEWSYSYGIAVQSQSFQDMLSNIGKPRAPKKATPEEAVDAMGFVVSLRGKIRRWWAWETVTGVPKVIRDYQIGLERKARTEQATFDALPDSEKQKQTDNAISKLFGMGGFAVFNIAPAPAVKQKSTITAQPKFKKKFDFED
jgi:hypothetical protein